MALCGPARVRRGLHARSEAATIFKALAELFSAYALDVENYIGAAASAAALASESSSTDAEDQNDTFQEEDGRKVCAPTRMMDDAGGLREDLQVVRDGIFGFEV